MKKTILVAAALILGVTVWVFAQEQSAASQSGEKGNRPAGKMMQNGRGGPGMMGNRPMMGRGLMGMGREGARAEAYLRHREDLKLTDEQVKKIKDINVSFRKEMIDTRARLETGRLELGQMLDTEKPDMSAVEKKVRANHEVQAGMVIATIRANRAADAVLNPDQLKSSKTLAPRFQQANRHMGPMGGRPGGNFMNRNEHPQAPANN